MPINLPYGNLAIVQHSNIAGTLKTDLIYIQNI